MHAILAGLLLLFGPIAASGEVELFDTDKEKVVEIYANSDLFQQEAKEMLDSVSGRVQELSPSLERALILRIPLTPPQDLTVESTGIDAQIVEMFVVMPKQGARRPWMIVHTKDGDSLLLEFARGAEKVQRLLERVERKTS
ncbi:hypothetical protein LOK74_23785 [Brevibacillus humidisoli]|uniref:hypothetical protein n=1 Tax=Brevibacillus humidisoli TaxID=2895522 RepID=UPI001E2C87A2|nr:hypothetical protein [Brevibacillus humidisoli]UFJ40968.1 hypothetical protein LOK74_23785 [Brevibacillus humidisoli]